MSEDTTRDILSLIQEFAITSGNLHTLNQKVDTLTANQTHLHRDVEQILQIVRDGTGSELSLQRRSDNMQAEILGLHREIEDIHKLNRECREDRAELRKYATRGRWNVYVSMISGLFSLIAVALAVWLKT